MSLWSCRLFALAIIIFITLTCLTVALQCPANCKCKRKTVTCEHLHLTEIPQYIPNDTEYLYIGYNLITKIEANAFGNLPNLTALSLKGNVLYIIHDNAFEINSKLTDIFLTNNKLETISKEAFKGLTSLTNFYLTNNKIKAIPDMEYAVSLKKLNLDNNKLTSASFPEGFSKLLNLSNIILAVNPAIESLKSSDFNNIKSPKFAKISLSRCNIKSIERETFSAFKNLESLSISYNKINQSQATAFINGLGGSHILSLDISAVFQGLSNLPTNTFQSLSDDPLLELKMSHSDISILSTNCFQGLSRLTFLDVSKSQIATTEANAFAGLDTLKTLYIDNNKLSVIPADLPTSVETLDISFNNLITEIPGLIFIKMEKLTALYMNNCGITIIHNEAFAGINNLVTMDLSYNKIGGSNIGAKVLTDLNKLTHLYLQGNRFTNINKDIHLFDGLTSLLLLNMSNSQCERLDNGLFGGLNNLKTLVLSKNSLGEHLAQDINGQTFKGLSNLRELYLNDNGISSLPGALFKDLNSLEKLNLQNNELYHWDSEVFLPLVSLKFSDLSHNEISLVNQTSMMHIHGGVQLDLSKNPFSCGCDLVWFRNWVNTTNVTFLYLSSYTCHSPTKLQGKPLLSFKTGDIMFTCNWRYILYACVSGVFLLTVVSAVLLYHYRWKLRFRYYFAREYLRRRKLLRAGNIQDENTTLLPQSPEYNAILSRHDEDTFVEDTLLPKIKDIGYKIFDPKYDIDFGKNHAIEFAEKALPHISAKMIIVVSEKYLESCEKCQYEFAIGLARIKEGREVMIIISLGSSASLAVRAPAYISAVMRDREQFILEWNPEWNDNATDEGAQVFFQKLREMLDQSTNRDAV